MTIREAPKRPVLRYHGGKWKLAPWIISHFPPHKCYTEAFGGGASVLLRKPRSYAEVYNDLDGEIANVFRVLRDPQQAWDLARVIELTPFAREEFELSYKPDPNPVEQARRTIFRTFAGFGTNSVNARIATGFRANSNRPGTTPAHDWSHFPLALREVITRLSGVVIENRDALEIIRAHDAPETLHYVDPPYPHETRSARSRKNYRFELTDDDHRELAACLRNCAGMVALSSYNCPLYEELYSDWQRVDRFAYADGARARVESLWLNPAASRAQTRLALDLEAASAAD